MIVLVPGLFRNLLQPALAAVARGRWFDPPAAAVRRLVTAVFWLATAGVIACLSVLGLLVPRLAAVRQIAVAAAEFV
ncbi:MAG: hypothetical protein M3Y33_00720 [Actinomycetota bacterium]|nr:hypothetical protein [Actinomycetota bacterium]